MCLREGRGCPRRVCRVGACARRAVGAPAPHAARAREARACPAGPGAEGARPLEQVKTLFDTPPRRGNVLMPRGVAKRPVRWLLAACAGRGLKALAVWAKIVFGNEMVTGILVW